MSQIIVMVSRLQHQHVSEPNTLYKVIGIDLGSTFARVGVSRNNSCEIICDEEGRSAIPNYVSFLDNGAPLVGFEANEKALSSPRNTIYDIR
jgi:molecular chaperone DnaK (HSP70)